MDKVRILVLKVTLIPIVVASIGFTKAHSPSPDYYINDQNICVISPVSDCLRGIPTCIVDIPGQAGGKQLYDTRTTSGICMFTLTEGE